MSFNAACEKNELSFKSENAPCIKLSSLKKKESTLKRWNESFLKRIPSVDDVHMKQ